MTPVQDVNLWRSLPLPSLLIDPEDLILDINPAAESYLNASARVVHGQPLWERLEAEDTLARAFSRARRNGAPLFVNDIHIGLRERPAHLCNLSAAPLADHPGQMFLLIAPRELAGLMTQGNSARTAAKSAIGMAEMLAHEIKNPLAGISGAAQLLAMSLDAEGRELSDLIVAETHRIVRLLKQVEQFGNRVPPDFQAVNLHDVLDRARRSASLGFAAHLTIHTDYDPSLPLAWVDGDQLLQVISNLLRNVAEALGPTGGNLWLRSYYEHSFRLSRNDGKGVALPLQIEVIDDGPGIPEEIADFVFDPFVSGRENGTGLGLALVSKIIAELGGMIALTSVPGRTVFRISLPRAPQATGEEG